eukprot:1226146-Prymnesium_polylepis.1
MLRRGPLSACNTSQSEQSAERTEKHSQCAMANANGTAGASHTGGDGGVPLKTTHVGCGTGRCALAGWRASRSARAARVVRTQRLQIRHFAM